MVIRDDDGNPKMDWVDVVRQIPVWILVGWFVLTLGLFFNLRGDVSANSEFRRAVAPQVQQIQADTQEMRAILERIERRMGK